jgi:hypothetical protein
MEIFSKEDRFDENRDLIVKFYELINLNLEENIKNFEIVFIRYFKDKILDGYNFEKVRKKEIIEKQVKS